MRTNSYNSKGFSLIELLLVLAVLALLFLLVWVSISRATQKASDVELRNNVRQLRLLAETVFDGAGASYKDWSTDELVADHVAVLQDDIDRMHGHTGTPRKSVIIDSRVKEFCISAELKASDEGAHFCADASGKFVVVNSPCSKPDNPGDPLMCP